MKTIRLAHAAIKWMTLTLTILILAFSMFRCGSSQEYADPAQNLLAKSVKALGGAEKACDWTTRIDKGVLSSERPGWGNLHAKCTLSIKKPIQEKY